MHNSVLVVGTGTIGEPLTGLLATLSKELGLDEVIFYKHTPRKTDYPLVEGLLRKGAHIASNKETHKKWKEMGVDVTYTFEEALDRSKIVADCSFERKGIENKEKFYKQRQGKIQNFLAQGSETGFGIPYATGINDFVLEDYEKNKFIQVVSCNTHNISSVLKNLAFGPDGPQNGNGNKCSLVAGKFMAIRRAADVSQASSFIGSPEVGTHKDLRFGTHHAQDANRLFKTMGYDLAVFSSAIKIPTQYMHTLFFDLKLKEETTKEEVMKKFVDDPYVAITHKRQSALVFSFGREHGFYGRILDQSVVVEPTVSVLEGGKDVVGYCFTPQDGNSLFTSTTAITQWMSNDWEDTQKRLKCLDRYRFDEV
ncbi:MAG: Glyceraldehyde-3-phosphate dehydrogenase [Candidatus Heimdallarchaeota archaeon LC_3]|nr:MAG: Glyceraldehyde-3-phosphate dehydrogenase [Candidatus Heimdallarchaeota archaeon LC_3]